MKNYIPPFIAIVLMAAAGCQSPAAHFYTLNRTVTRQSTNDLPSAVAVGPVTIPMEVDRPQFTLRISANQLAIDEFHRWAEPLDNAIARVVAGDLAALLGASRVSSVQMAGLNPAYRVSLNILQFDSVPGKSARIEALWTIRKTADGTVFSGRSEVTEPVQADTFDDLAAAHSRALAKISGDIAAVIRASEKEKT